jgi:hypothetical protein
MKRKDENHRLYYIEQYPLNVNEKVELYTFEDVQQVAKHTQLLHPEISYVIREFSTGN